MESILTVVASINKALEIAQSKGAFTLQQSAATYNNLQTLSKYFEKIKQKYDQEQAQEQAQEQEIQGISHMTQEEAIDSENQENRGIILNEKEQKEVEKINAIEDLIRQTVEASSEEEESDEIIEEQAVEDEEVEVEEEVEEVEEVEEQAVEDEEVEVEEEVEEQAVEDECKIEEEVVDVSIVANNSPNDNHIVSNLKNKKPIYVFSKKEQERKRQLQKPIYSDDESSDDNEIITI